LFGFIGLSRANKSVLAESLILVSLVSVAIRLLPFRLVVRAASGKRAEPALGDEQRAMVMRCRWAVEKWAERVPWKAVCFQKGLAFHMMLRRRGIASTLHYGVMQDEERGLTAHVWVSEGGRILMGGEIASDYTPLASFPAADGAEPVSGRIR
jgi:hypothetical protein